MVSPVDETALRQRAREFIDGLHQRRAGSSVAFASKSFPCTAIYRVMAEEGLHIDVAGAGELITALKAGVPASQVVLHGNAKTDHELGLAVDAGVGTIVIDGWDDIARLERTTGPPQSVLVRVIPGVDAPTTPMPSSPSSCSSCSARSTSSRGSPQYSPMTSSSQPKVAPSSLTSPGGAGPT